MRLSKPALALTIILAVELVVFGVSTIPGVRAREGFDPVLDGWLQGAGYVTVAALALLRPLTSTVSRVFWGLLAAGLCLRAAAFVYYLSVVRELEPIPYPSLSDLGWLAMSGLMLLALTLQVRGRLPRMAAGIVLDALVGALAATALALALLHPTLVEVTAAGIPSPVLATNIAYPISDLALLIMLLGALAAFEWRPPPAVWLLSAGIAGFAVVDTVFLYQVTAGTFRPGSPLAALSLLATALIALSAWLPAQRPRRGARAVVPGLFLPALFAFVCLGLLVYAATTPVPLASVVLASAGLVTVIVRTLATFQQVEETADLRGQARRQAGVAEIGRVALDPDSGLEQVFDRAVDITARALDVELARVLELRGQSFVQLASRGWEGVGDGNPIAIDREGTGAALTLESEATVVIDSLLEDARLSGRREPEAPEVSSAVHVPISIGADEVWGVLGVNSRMPRAFSEEDADFMRAIAHVLGSAVERRRATRELRLQAAVLDGMSEGVVISHGGWSERIVLYANPAIERTIGHELGSLRGRSTDLFRFADPELRDRVVRAVRERGRWQGELSILTRSGDERLLAAQVTMVADPFGDEAIVSVAADITDERKSEVARRRAEEERRRLIAELVEVEERERRRIAGEIHDDSIQALSAARLRLSGIAEQAEAGPLGNEIDLVDQDLRDAISALRELLFELRPPALAEGGLERALRDLLDELEHEGGPRGELSGSLAAEPPIEVRTIVYRVAREALVNARRHAGTERVEVSLQGDDRSVRVRVRDFGSGFSVSDARARPGHLGLVTMRERAESAGGWLHIDSHPGVGTTVEASVPLLPA